MRCKIFPIVLLCIFGSGCSLIGNQLGKAVDDGLNEDTYEDQYTREGLEADVEIARVLLAKDKTVPITEELACAEPRRQKVCSAAKGCWCE